MTRLQKQALILAALILVMIPIYAGAMRAPKLPPRPAGTPAIPQEENPRAVQTSVTPGFPMPLASPVPPELLAHRKAQRQRATLLPWRRDPFSPATTGSEGSGLVLSGILWDPVQPIAIINGQPATVGDEVEGYRVVKIAQDRVTVSDSVQTVHLRLSP
jgi:hypothetical protein